MQYKHIDSMQLDLILYSHSFSFLFDCSEVSGDREVQRTMLELLNQLDGFSSDERIKVKMSYWMCACSTYKDNWLCPDGLP
jgi:hypothetical protein